MAFYLGVYFSDPNGSSPVEIDLSTYVQFYTPAEGFDRVAEQIQIRLPTGLAAARTVLLQLRDALRRARESSLASTPPRVFLAFDPAGLLANAYTAQIFDGDLQPGQTILSKGQLNYGIFDYTLTVTREGIWTNNATSTAVGSVTTPLGMAYNSVSSTWRVYNSAFRETVTAEVLGAGDGATLAFSGTTTKANLYRSRTTPVFKYTIGGVNYSYSYDQLKYIAAGTTKVASVSVTFDTGAWSITFSTAPDNATNITLDYVSGYGNWLQFDGQSGPGFATYPYTPTGDMQGAVNVALTNKHATEDLDTLWMGCYYAPDGGNYPELWYEAEDAGSIETSGAVQGDAQCSAAEQVAWTVTTTESVLLDFTLASAQVAIMAGKWYAPIVRYGDTNQSNIPAVRLRWRVYTDLAGVRDAMIFETDQYLPADNGKILHQIGIVQLPPQTVFNFAVLDSSITTTGPGDIHLVLTGQAVGTDRALSIDAVQLMPTDWFCKFEYTGAIPPDDILRINSYDQYGAHEPSGDSIRSAVVLHDWPVVDPRRDCRIYVLWTDATDDQTDFAWPLAVSALYYPRRGSI